MVLLEDVVTGGVVAVDEAVAGTVVEVTGAVVVASFVVVAASVGGLVDVSDDVAVQDDRARRSPSVRTVIVRTELSIHPAYTSRWWGTSRIEAHHS